MGNKLSCSCAPLIRRAYRYEDSPWQHARRRDGHLLRLWAEVFHVHASSGAVKWQQVSEDLVPVNITCIQDTPDCVFHITAYNSQVEKILDVRLVQPGTRLGQASECFVYWKDPATGDTWGLNFTSPIDAKQFRECCSPSFKFSRKASSSYSLKLEPPKQQKTKGGKRKPQSTPSSPSRSRELQCTCMTAENLHRARNGRVRYTGGAATLPRAQPATRTSVDDYRISYDSTARSRSRQQHHTTSSTSVYDNARRGTTTASVHGGAKSSGGNSQASPNNTVKTSLQDRISDASAGNRYAGEVHGSPPDGSEQARQLYATRKEQAKSIDCSLMSERRERGPRSAGDELQPQSRSKSSDNVFEQSQAELSLDSNTLKRMLHPLPQGNSVHSSPEQEDSVSLKKRELLRKLNSDDSRDIRRIFTDRSRMHRSETGRRRSLERTMCLDLPDPAEQSSPPSDHFLYDNFCYATTPSSSNDNSDGGGGGPYCVSSDEGPPYPGRGSPTSKLLMEYEMHLRNALARGLDAESYSLHTFEALLSQSMENVVALMREVHNELEAIRQEERNICNLDGMTGNLDKRTTTKCSTLPLPQGRPMALSSGALSSAGNSFETTASSIPQQLSTESNDSRIYLTSSEVRDPYSATLVVPNRRRQRPQDDGNDLSF